MAYQPTVCKDEGRRADLTGHPTLNGIDFLEVAPDQLTLRIFFLNPLPAGAYGIPAAPHQVRVTGGVRVRDIRIVSVVLAGPSVLQAAVDHFGDFSTYTLIIDNASIDPVYGQVYFSFKAGCPTRFDCKPKPCPTETEPAVAVDYLAKDYASFRRALLDFLSVRAPNWKEQNPADVGMMLLELIAYVGDQLSYYQDSVSNEAFLETALQRISVRRHARLIDYHMMDGASARTFIFCAVTAPVTLPKATPLFTRIDRPLGPVPSPHPAALAPGLADEAFAAATAVFETCDQGVFQEALNAIELYSWGDSRCCLPKGSTRADLVGDLTALLTSGSYLLLEELTDPVLGPDPRSPSGLLPDTPLPAADRGHRQVVRLTKVELGVDPLNGSLTRVYWDEADALRFPFCASSLIDSGPIPVGVARGNLVLCDHGRSRTQAHVVGPSPRAYRFELDEAPLSFRLPYSVVTPVADIESADPGTADPAVVALSVTTGSATQAGWQPAPDLLGGDPFAKVFAVETNNAGAAVLRFGDNEYGQGLSEGSVVAVSYRTGIGVTGNVGQEALAHVVDTGVLGSIRTIRNPIAAWGGTDPESIPRVKEVAPAAFRAEQFRAVTEADYVVAAEKHPQVSHALARFRWTGSWLTVFITVDPRAGVPFDETLKESVRRWVTRYTLAGYDLEIRPPVYVALDLEIEVCVSHDHFRSDVEQAILEALGSAAVFNPDRFTFGQPLYLSALYAAMHGVPGVSSVVARRFRRFDEDDPDPFRPATRANIDRSYIRIGDTEILRLENDPSFPENGSLRLAMLGGKG